MTSRRQFLKQSIVGGAALGLSWPYPAFAFQDKQLNILFLGGTGFLGPHTIRAALARGHKVTLFNRGKSNPHLFPELEKLRGDRYDNLDALKGRQWDAVIDTFAYVPRVVTASAELLADSVKQYVLISSISVYAKFEKAGMDEAGPLAIVPPEAVESIKTHREVGMHYGGMKALCEQAAEQAMPGRVANIRPGLIVGPGDPTDRFTYWPVRVSRGGEVLAPGTGSDYTQFIDVRDLASFIVTCIENNTVGVYNADAPAASVTMKKLLDTCVQQSKTTPTITWVDTDFLAAKFVQPWAEMPVWVPPRGDYAGFGQVSVAKAQAKGLTQRPIGETIGDTLAWYSEEPAERQQSLRAGIKPEKEKEVLAAWHARNSKAEPAMP